MSGGRLRVLLATWEGGGVIPPEMGLARRLIARGHDVHVIADPAVAKAAREAGCGFSPWVRAPHKSSLAPEEDILRDWEFKNPLKFFAHALEVFLCGPQDRFAADALEAIDRHRADLVLADFFILGAMMAAEARGLPFGVLVPNIYVRPAPGIPPMGPGFLPARGPLGRLRDAVLRGLSNQLWTKGLPAVNRARTGLGLAPLLTFWDQYDRANAVYVLTSQAFDFPAKELPRNVRYVGPLLDEPSWVAPWTPPWPADHQDPLVLVGLSSTYQNQVAALSRIVEALATLPVRALVTLGPALDPGAVGSPSPNVVVVPTAPHGAVLAHASLAITHCGHGTTLKALSAGVPLLCMPMGRDQNDTAARVVARGAGLRLAPTASVAQIRRTVPRLLADPSYREAAHRLSGAIAAESRTIDLPAEIESLVAPRAPAARADRSSAPVLHG